MSADVKAAKEFLETPDNLIMKKNDFPEEIFNTDENSLFYKQMARRIFTHKEAKTMPDFKAFKFRMTILLGDNVAG